MRRTSERSLVHGLRQRSQLFAAFILFSTVSLCPVSVCPVYVAKSLFPICIVSVDRGSAGLAGGAGTRSMDGREGPARSAKVAACRSVGSPAVASRLQGACAGGG